MVENHIEGEEQVQKVDGDMSQDQMADEAAMLAAQQVSLAETKKRRKE